MAQSGSTRAGVIALGWLRWGDSAPGGYLRAVTERAPLAPLLATLKDSPAFGSILGSNDATIAIPDSARAASVAALAELTRRSPLVVAVPLASDAERLVDDLRNFLPHNAVELFPAWETLPFERVSPAVSTMGARVRGMWRLRTRDPELLVLVAPARALVQRLGPHVEETEPIFVRPGDVVDIEGFVRELVAVGYRREYQVEHRGEVAVRGSIVDVFPSTAEQPVRIDLWGDEVDRLTRFSVADQRSLEDIDVVEIVAARELLPTDEVRQRAEALMTSDPWGREQWQRIADGEIFDGMEAWLAWLSDAEHVLFDLLDEDALVLMCDPSRLRDRASDIISEEVSLAGSLSRTWDLVDGVELPRLHLDFERLLEHTDAAHWLVTSIADGPGTPAVEAMSWPAAVGNAEAVIAQVRSLLADDHRVIVCADSEGAADRIQRALASEGVDLALSAPGSPALRDPGGHLVICGLAKGAIFSDLKVAFLAEADLTGRRRTHKVARRRVPRSERFFEDLKVGDHVVHLHHGVGRFEGMVRRSMGGSERDYLMLEYKGGDKLYVPSDQIDTITLYSGGETPRLNKMGGADFSRTKAKVRSEVAKIAQELVVLYQKRRNAKGHAFDPDTPWQQEMESSFPFQETPDQLRAVAEVKDDMETLVPMDRLICGDVGFGKTEVAVRAAFKAIENGYQVAVLVPTTLLAQQHHQTFSERFSGYPIRVEVLSRFLTPAQSRKVSDGIADGEVDLVIGTHKLLSKEVKFKKLGLLVVDEEQRFGVNHKEAMKQLKTNVDVLTLSATPIPRTLEMSLTGIRDLSLLQTPPAARQPILTYVGEFDQNAVGEAIRRELLREGQVFYVHNRVRDIELQAERLRDLVPEARVAVAHGQMDEGTLERVVVDFWEGAYDVLVCTTIIESGIDMPTVNTLVVERADLLGLGQMHQLRGRVGRAGQRAYAYLFHPRDKVLTEEAYERLKTIGETTELGSGFRIAMRDLEIRGAGNLLGTGQSGHVASVGYDLYMQMVNEAISELNGEGIAPEAAADVTIELPMAAHLPSDYVERDDLRLDAYRRLAKVETTEAVEEIAAEWVDRFGPVPEPAQRLLSIARLRAECVRTGVTEVSVTKVSTMSGGGFMARLSPLTLAQSKQMRLERLYRGSHYKSDEATGIGRLQLPLKSASSMADDLISALVELVPDKVPAA